MTDTSLAVITNIIREAAHEVRASQDYVDPEAAKRARHRYSCFEHFGEDTEVYGYEAGFGLSRSCEDEVVNELVELQRHMADYSRRDGRVVSNWCMPHERKRVRPALEGSYEMLFHAAEMPGFLLNLSNAGRKVKKGVYGPRLERAIGVIYLPQTERISHYFNAVLPEQFDAVLHFDETHALEPLDRTELWEQGEVPETFPSAL